MSESIAHLDDETSVDPRGTLRGAWREIGVRYVAAGATVRLVADGSEHAIYVWSGYGTAVTSEGAIDVAEGSAFTIVRGDSVSFEAGAEGLRLFVATLGA